MQNKVVCSSDKVSSIGIDLQESVYGKKLRQID